MSKSPDPSGLSDAPTIDTAVDFLERLRPSGPWALTAIPPDKIQGEPPTITTTAHDAVAVQGPTPDAAARGVFTA